jgi:hypothetical protein
MFRASLVNRFKSSASTWNKATANSTSSVASTGTSANNFKAVSKADALASAPHAIPASRSVEETQMPWEGWISALVKDKLGQSTLDKIRNVLTFRPDDPHKLHQIPYPNTKTNLTSDPNGPKASFRYPSPGSQQPAGKPPVEDEGSIYSDPYFISHAPRDTARRYADPAFPSEENERLKLNLLPQDSPEVQELQEKFQAGPQSSPGNKGRFATGPSNFDDTGGLRATMSTNHAVLNQSLDSFMPNHLPTPTWFDDAEQDKIVAWYKEHNLPVPLGATGWGCVPREGRIARW